MYVVITFASLVSLIAFVTGWSFIAENIWRLQDLDTTVWIYSMVLPTTTWNEFVCLELVLCKALLHNYAITAIGQVATTIAGFIFAVAGVLAVACFSIRLDVIFSFLF